jgi:hypothetical protein
VPAKAPSSHCTVRSSCVTLNGGGTGQHCEPLRPDGSQMRIVPPLDPTLAPPGRSATARCVIGTGPAGQSPPHPTVTAHAERIHARE